MRENFFVECYQKYLQNPHQQTWACHRYAPHQNICPDMDHLCVDENFHCAVGDPLVCPSHLHHVWYADHGDGVDLPGPSVPHASWGSPSTLVHLPIPLDSLSQHQSLQSHALTEMAAATRHLKKKRNSYYTGQVKKQATSACRRGFSLPPGALSGSLLKKPSEELCLRRFTPGRLSPRGKCSPCFSMGAAGDWKIRQTQIKQAASGL